VLGGLDHHLPLKLGPVIAYHGTKISMSCAGTTAYSLAVPSFLLDRHGHPGAQVLLDHREDLLRFADGAAPLDDIQEAASDFPRSKPCPRCLL
jgi:hypothetical protein